MIDDKEKAVSSIVPSAGTGLAMSTSELVRRGLQELSNRQDEEKRPRVMVVSTEEAINERYSEVLNENGCVAIDAEEQRKAGWPPEATIEKIKAFHPDFVFLFRVWPQMTGSNIARSLFEHLPDVKFIIGTMDSDTLLNTDSVIYAKRLGRHCQIHDVLSDGLDGLLAKIGIKKLPTTI